MKSKQLIQERLCLLQSELKVLNNDKINAEKNSSHYGWSVLNNKHARVESKIGILQWVLDEEIL